MSDQLSTDKQEIEESKNPQLPVPKTSNRTPLETMTANITKELKSSAGKF